MEPTEELKYNNDSKSQEFKYTTQDPNHTESQIRLSTDKIQMGLRVLKITMASITLPRLSRKGNLANVVLHRTCLLTCPGYIPKTAISTGWYLARLDVKLRQLVP